MWAFLWVIFMAIESVNLTVPGGDTPRSAFTKLNSNFSNQTHAASRLVGVSNGQIPTMEGLEGIGGFGLGGRNKRIEYTSRQALQDAELRSGMYKCKSLLDGPLGNSYVDWYLLVNNSHPLYISLIAISIDAPTDNMYFCSTRPENGWRDWSKVYTSKNTTLDGNGALKPSSPVLRVFSDRITGNDDGDAMAAEYTKNGVGDYTITGTTGLRTDGWYVVIPNDMNGNPKVAITLDDTDGVITLRSYVRIFDMTTFKFVPDLEQPLDIPEGRWIDLRFNDLPIDALTQTN